MTTTKAAHTAGREARLAAIEKRLKSATPGPWSSDTIKNEGEYSSYQIIVEVDGKTETLCDSVNASYQLIDEEFGGDENGDWHEAWDDIARRNFDLIANAPDDLHWLLSDNRRLAKLLAKVAPIFDQNNDLHWAIEAALAGEDDAASEARNG